MTKLTIPLHKFKKTKDIREKKTQTHAGEYINEIGNMPATKSYRELKLVSYDCYDHILYTVDKKYLKELYPHQNTTDTDVYTDNCKRA